MKNLNKRTIFIALGTLLIGILIGWLFLGNSKPEADEHYNEVAEGTIWTCSMHPQIRQSEPGKCPICGMDLIPLNSEAGTADPMEVNMSPTAMQLANVQTLLVSKQNPVKEVRMNGKVAADERLISSQPAHIAGRVERLLVDFTGERVNRGQVLAYIYSPDLVLAQEELLEAYKIRESQPALYEAARGKLKNWRLTDAQINRIIQSGKIQQEFPVLADVSGIVLNKRVSLGDYVQRGQSLFEIADLSKVWVLFDVYESDMPWVRKGDVVTFTVQSLPGETFEGPITFIDPLIDPKTRVAQARVEVSNKGRQLKPEMFASGVLSSPLKNVSASIVVPKSAVMWTGERSVVYVKEPSATGVNFKMREVKLGPAMGDSYIIEEGLAEGEEIATNGTFSIDAAAQLAGKPSMMNPEGGPSMTGHDHGGKSGNAATASQQQPVTVTKQVKAALEPLFEDYLEIKNALVADDMVKAKRDAASLLSQMGKINMSIFTGEAHNIWMEHSAKSEKALKAIAGAENIGEVRRYFMALSDQFIALAKAFGPFGDILYIEHCPMANSNEGADWISADKEIRNPYFGKGMLTCGEIIKEIK